MKVKANLVNKHGQSQSMLIETTKNGIHELERIKNFLKNSFKPKQLTITPIA